MRSIILSCLVLSVAGCHPPKPMSNEREIPVAPQPIQSALPQYTTGPTELSKVAGGYELKNRLFRVVISDQTGDVIFWGLADHNRNLLIGRGIYTTLTGLPDSPPHGYIEQRDEQTWQYYGDDDNHITWRKIYCLDRDSLFVSIMVENNRPQPLDAAIQIKTNLPGLHIQHHDPELLEASVDHTALLLRGYNEFPAPASQPASPTLIQSDIFHFKPQERQSYTSQWKLQTE